MSIRDWESVFDARDGKMSTLTYSIGDTSVGGAGEEVENAVASPDFSLRRGTPRLNAYSSGSPCRYNGLGCATKQTYVLK